MDKGHRRMSQFGRGTRWSLRLMFTKGNVHNTALLLVKEALWDTPSESQKSEAEHQIGDGASGRKSGVIKPG